MPVGEVLKLEAIDPLKAPYFLTRREMGIFSVGGPGIVKAGDATFELDFKEALYLGSGDREVTFESKDPKNPAKFYFNSTTAHRNYPDKKVTKADAVVAAMGSLEMSNDRNINKMIVNQVLPTCQLQMGMTELKPGSVWNTMPAHVHSRRMEAYFYFDIPEDQAICHFMVWLPAFPLVGATVHQGAPPFRVEATLTTHAVFVGRQHGRHLFDILGGLRLHDVHGVVNGDDADETVFLIDDRQGDEVVL